MGEIIFILAGVVFFGGLLFISFQATHHRPFKGRKA